jgi:predicted outer membrane repeat protein
MKTLMWGMGVAAMAGFVGRATCADIIYVNDDNCPGPGDGTEGDPYCSIQTAIDNAVDGDEIIVAPGTYLESVSLLSKAITLRSSEGAGVTTIDAQGSGTVVTCNSGVGPETAIQGFTITGGFFSVGGGMLLGLSSPTVRNCTFTGNAAVDGGALYSVAGGPTIIDCSFIGNTAEGDGGAMYLAGGNPTVIGCTFEANAADEFGGAMHNNNSISTVTDCTFNGNSAYAGGGMYSIELDPVVTNCAFTMNSATVGAGMMNQASSPTVANCTFAGNLAGVGGGMVNFTSSSTIVNCTFTNNTATAGGSGMLNAGGVPTVMNCIFWIAHILGDADVSYSTVHGGWPGVGNIDAYPRYVNYDAGDYRLLPNSPCIDAGHNWAIAGLADTDLDGSPRFADGPVDDTGCGLPVVVDMGAYEYQGDPFPVRLGDIDGDGAVGVTDFLLLLAGWGACTADCCLPDLDLDGDVGVADFLILLAEWG